MGNGSLRSVYDNAQESASPVAFERHREAQRIGPGIGATRARATRPHQMAGVTSSCMVNTGPIDDCSMEIRGAQTFCLVYAA